MSLSVKVMFLNNFLILQLNLFQVIIDIADGNDENIFKLEQTSEWSAQIKATNSLRGKHGNYTLTMRAQDLGTPSMLVEEHLKICVIDYNDHPPMFVSPPHNSTLKVPEVRF